MRVIPELRLLRSSISGTRRHDVILTTKPPAFLEPRNVHHAESVDHEPKDGQKIVPQEVGV